MPATATKVEDLDDLFSLKGKNAVVIGGAGGIGRGLAGGLLRYGAQVAIADINLSALETAVAELRESRRGRLSSRIGSTPGRRAASKRWWRTGQPTWAASTSSSTPRASTSRPRRPSFPVADWDKLFSVNVRGVMLCCKHFAAHMVAQGGGKIINLSSIRGPGRPWAATWPTAPAKAPST